MVESPTGMPSLSMRYRQEGAESLGLFRLENRLADLGHRRFGDRARLGVAGGDDLVELLRLRGDVAALVLDRLDDLHHAVGELGLAVDAAELAGAAVALDLGDAGRGREDLVPGVDVADLGMAGVVALLSRGVRDHRLDLLARGL